MLASHHPYRLGAEDSLPKNAECLHPSLHLSSLIYEAKVAIEMILIELNERTFHPHAASPHLMITEPCCNDDVSARYLYSTNIEFPPRSVAQCSMVEII